MSAGPDEADEASSRVGDEESQAQAKEEEGRRPEKASDDDKPVRLFVGGLPAEADDEDLRKEFSKFSDLEESKVIRDRGSGKSRKFGFVVLKDGSRQEQLIRDPPSVRGKKVTVKLHQEVDHDAQDDDEASRKVFIGRLDSKMSSGQIKDALSDAFGKVTDVFVANGRNFGFVTFSDSRDARAALDASSAKVDGVPIVIKSADPMGSGRSSGGRDRSPPRTTSTGYSNGYMYGYPPPGGNMYGYPPVGYPPAGYYGYPPPAYGYPSAYGYPPAYGYQPPSGGAYGYGYPAPAAGGQYPAGGQYGPAPTTTSSRDRPY